MPNGPTYLQNPTSQNIDNFAWENVVSSYASCTSDNSGRYVQDFGPTLAGKHLAAQSFGEFQYLPNDATSRNRLLMVKTIPPKTSNNLQTL